MKRAETKASNPDDVAKLYEKYVLGYNKKILKKYKITEKQADEFAREGQLKNWPMPPTK